MVDHFLVCTANCMMIDPGRQDLFLVFVLGIRDGVLGIALEAVDVSSPRIDSEAGHHDIKDFRHRRLESFMRIACGSPRGPRAIRLRLPTSREST